MKAVLMYLAIDEIVEHGQVFNLRREVVMDRLRNTVRDLFEELHKLSVNYVLVGGVALLSYVQGRNTQDIDLIVDPKQLQYLQWQPTIQDRDFGQADYRGLHVDLLLTTNPLFAHVQQHERTTVDFSDLQVSCATREGLLLLKLYMLPSLHRQQNFVRAALYETDILMLHQNADIDDEQLLHTLSNYMAAHDIDELRGILQEQRQRKRFT